MLTPLSRAVGAWTPGSGRPKTPGEHALGAILSLWPTIVGEDVAKHTVPLERKGDALVVMTSSSAWSNQLSLLSGHIVCALSDAGVDGIERLRFRIGRVRRGPLGIVSNGHGKALESRAPSVSAATATSTAEEAFSRFRERVDRGRDAKRADGWNQCSKCGVMLPEGNRCASCTTAEISRRSARVQRLMFDVPWLGFKGISSLVEGLSQDEYEMNKTALLARWWEALERVRKTATVSPDGLERQIASSYLLLKTGWEPDRITPLIARNELGDVYDLLYEKHHNK
ncbi:MAG TPA: DUF721 domain-containing protein [Candidatus Baltobacteraceae bacterium]|jgi:hypothetical protein